MDRRSFFSKIFGGAAAVAVAPHLQNKPSWTLRHASKPLYDIIPRAATLKPLKRTFHAYNQSPCVDAPLLTNCILETEMGELEVAPNLEPIPDLEISAQDGFGVTEDGLFGETIPGCPTGYY